MTENEEFKITLEADLKAVQAELETIATQHPTTMDWVAIPDSNDIGNADENVEADAVEGWNERRAVMTQLETRYRNIVRALQKIEAGTYGICEISGEQIEVDRLKANPAARTNIENIDRETELPI